MMDLSTFLTIPLAAIVIVTISRLYINGIYKLLDNLK